MGHNKVPKYLSHIPLPLPLAIAAEVPSDIQQPNLPDAPAIQNAIAYDNGYLHNPIPHLTPPAFVHNS